MSDPGRELGIEELFSAAEAYHENSKLHPSDIATFQTIAMVNSSVEIQRIVSRPRAGFPGFATVDLTRPAAPAPGSFEAILQQRRSVREFSGESISLAALGRLLHLGDGTTRQLSTAETGVRWELRTAPSPGGLFPIDLYCFALRVEGLAAGLYFYDVSGHRLEQLVTHDFSAELAAALYLPTTVQAALCIALVAVFPRVAFKYGERAYRFALLEAGHIAQNVLLAAVADGLGAVPIGGFQDSAVCSLLQVDGCEEAPLYFVVAGR